MPDDITHALAASGAGFRELIEKTADGVLVVQPDGVIVYANPAAAELLGRRIEELIGAMFGQPLVPGATTEIDVLPGVGRPCVAEMRIVEVAWAGSPASLATLRDVTEHKRAQTTLSFLVDASNRLARSLDRAATLSTVAQLAVQHLADWCLIDLLEGRPSDQGGAILERLASAPRDPAREAKARTLCGRYSLAGGLPALSRVLLEGWMEVHPVVGPVELAALAREPRYEAIFQELGCRSALVAPMVAHNRCIGAITFLSASAWRSYGQQEQALAQNLADRAALALDNARLYDEAQEAVKRRDEFLAMLAHELRNPLEPIMTAAQLMKARTAGEESLERQRMTVERQGQHLSRLLDDLLDLSRVTHGKIDLRTQPLDLGGVVSDALQASRSLVEERQHQLVVAREEAPLIVEGDPTRLAQVLENLLNNAARYTPRGGRIHLAVHKESDEAVIRVVDNGHGIPPEMLTRIFEPFTQVRQPLDHSDGGLGIGLALVRRLVELHGGVVTASSEGLGQGSTFEVRLPLSDQTPQAKASAAGPSTPRRILLVEDNADGREMLGDLLRLWGHEVDTVGDGLAGLERIAQNQPDAALIDIGLPGLDGYQLAGQVRGLPQGQRVLLVAVTGYGLPEDRARALAAGFDAHLVKPVDLNKLAELLERGRN